MFKVFSGVQLRMGQRVSSRVSGLKNFGLDFIGFGEMRNGSSRVSIGVMGPPKPQTLDPKPSSFVLVYAEMM